MSDQSVSAVAPVSEPTTEQVTATSAAPVTSEVAKKTRRRLGGELELLIPASRVKNVIKAQLAIFNLEYMKYEIRTPDTKTRKVTGESVDEAGKSVKVYESVVHTHIPEKTKQVLRLGTEATLAYTCMCELLAEWLLDYAVQGCASQSKKKVEVNHLYDNDIVNMRFFNMVANCPNVCIEQNNAKSRQFIALYSSNYSNNKDMLAQAKLCFESTQQKFEPFVVSEPAMFSKFILNIFRRMQNEAYYKDFMLTGGIKDHISVLLQWFLRMMTLTTLPVVESVENATFKINNALKAIKTALFFQNDTASYNSLRTYVNNKMQLYYTYLAENPKPVKATTKKGKSDEDEDEFDSEDDGDDDTESVSGAASTPAAATSATPAPAESVPAPTPAAAPTPVATPTPAASTPAPTPVAAPTPTEGLAPVAEVTPTRKSRKRAETAAPPA